MTSLDHAPDNGARPPDRRVRRTQKAIRDAFVSLVLERGYDHVLIEDIAQRADIGRATFYAHDSDKDDLFAQLFNELSDELTARVDEVGGSPVILRTYLISMLYRDAVADRDLFRICLNGAGNGRARAKYQSTVAEAAARVYSDRVSESQFAQRVPVEMLANVFAGAHVAVLEKWLEQENPAPIDEVAGQFLRLVSYGGFWGSGILADDVMPKFPELLEPTV